MKGLTQRQVSAMTGVSSAHLGRIESGYRSPSARILEKLANPLGFSVGELFAIAGYLVSEPSTVGSEAHTGRIDPYVARILSEEPIEIQRYLVTILSVLKSMAKTVK